MSARDDYPTLHDVPATLGYLQHRDECHKAIDEIDRLEAELKSVYAEWGRLQKATP